MPRFYPTCEIREILTRKKIFSALTPVAPQLAIYDCSTAQMFTHITVMNATMKESPKLVHICQSYYKKSAWVFFL